MEPFVDQEENPESSADHSRWENQAKSPQGKMADIHHGSNIKEVDRTLVHHPNILFEPLSICNKFKDICNNISKPLSLNNRFKMLEMLNNYKSEYICDNHDNETLNYSNNNAYDIDDNDAMLNLNNNETLNVINNNVYDANDTMLMMNNNNMSNLISYNAVPNNTANTSCENDDDDDNTGAMGSHHRPSNHMNQNKSNNDCYICSFITPPQKQHQII